MPGSTPSPRASAWTSTGASRPPVAAREEGVRDSRPEYAELEHLAGGLPAKERAAVVLRYGYDLSYADIGMALGSSEEAARQAASSGVRRLRQRRIEIA